jgi:redox-sensitive bicupin YhaK (pirin superfamily)
MVSNDDIVSSGTGFGDHPHRDAEIITWVLSGSLVHQDSHGNRGVIFPGLAQRMSAGRGIIHSERNDAFRFEPDRVPEPVHFIQMWVRPDEVGAPPSYLQHELDRADLPRGWLPVASGNNPDAVITLGARGSTLWATILAPGEARTLPSAAFVHLYVARGGVELETVGDLMAGDSLRITGEAQQRIVGHSEAEVLLWAMQP